MTKLMEALQAKIMGNVRYPNKRMPFTTISLEREPTIDTMADRYRVEVSVGCMVNVRRGGHPSDLPGSESKVRRLIAQEIYGEFRPLLSLIDEAVLSYDIGEVARLIKELRSQMFDVDN